MLVSLAQALRLTTAEEQHLFLLAYQELPAKMMVEEEQVTPALQRVLDALNPHPAFLIGRRWDVLTWNRAADLLFHFHEPYPPHSRNVVWRFFLRGEARTFDPDWERQAQNLVAQFRADYARYPGDASFQEVIADLQRVSSQFRVWWEQQDVRGLPDGPRTMQHPTLGILEFDHVTFQMSTIADLRVKVYAASPETASKKVRSSSTARPKSMGGILSNCAMVLRLPISTGTLFSSSMSRIHLSPMALPSALIVFPYSSPNALALSLACLRK